MPGPLVLPLIAAGTTIGTNIFNAANQSANNKKSRKWNEKMYARQRADSLADFNLQNEYNDPKNQMSRLKAAGLNPNLVYGDGATTNAAPVRSNSADSWNPRAPEIDLSGIVSGLMSYFDAKLKDQQVNNLEKQNQLMIEQIKQAGVVTGKYAMDTANASFDLHQKEDMKKYNLTQAELQNEKTVADIKATLDANERAAVMQSYSIREAAERILNLREQRAKSQQERDQIRKQIDNLGKDMQLKQLDIDLKEKGIQPSDALGWRILGRLMERLNIK